MTGAAGFIGSEYVRAVLSGGLPGPDDVQVTVLDSLAYSGNPLNLAPVADHRSYQFVYGDICDPVLVNETVPGHDVIVHFAAESHVDRSIGNAAPFVTTNVLGTQVLLDAARRLLEACGAGWDMAKCVTDRKGHDRRYSLDISKISEELGYAPRVPFDEGLARTVDWYRANRSWWEPLKARAGLPRPTKRGRRWSI